VFTSGTVFKITGGFLYAFQGLLRGFSELETNFIEPSKNFDYDFIITCLQKVLKTISLHVQRVLILFSRP
jgi:hypothetical protein